MFRENSELSDEEQARGRTRVRSEEKIHENASNCPSRSGSSPEGVITAPRKPEGLLKRIPRPRQIWNAISTTYLQQPRRIIRQFKVAIAFTLAIWICISYHGWMGRYPFLFSTITIYLFPVKTWGSQVFHTGIGLTGILLGIGFCDASLAIAAQIQPSSPDPHFGRKFWLFSSLFLAAILAGYVRSKITFSYLGINFFMVVNMFGLIDGIETSQPIFIEFIRTMPLGALLSLAVTLIFPEDTSTFVKQDVVKCTDAATALFTSIRQTVFLGDRGEIQLAPLRTTISKLNATLDDAKYELSLSRVSAESLQPLRKIMNRIERLGSAIQSATEGKEQDFAVHPWNTFDQVVNQEEDNPRWKDHFDTAMQHAIQTLQHSSSNIIHLYEGMPIDHMDLDKFDESITQAIQAYREQRQYTSQEDLTVEKLSLVEHVNLMMVDLLNAVHSFGKIVHHMPERRYMRVWWPSALKFSCFHRKPSSRSTRSPASEIDDANNASEYGNHGTIASKDTIIHLREHEIGRTARSLLRFSHFTKTVRRSRHCQYSIKFAMVMGFLALPAFIDDWRVWFRTYRGQWAMISAMVTMETTQGLTLRTAGMKIIGAVTGSVLAAIGFAISSRHLEGYLTWTFLIGMMAGWFICDKQTAKAGTVLALAYSLVLLVAEIQPELGSVHTVLARRVGSLPVGLVMALLIQIMFFQSRARVEIHKAVSHELDEIARLMLAIVIAEEHPEQPNHFKKIVENYQIAQNYTKALFPATKYEFSIVGHFPQTRFIKLDALLANIFHLITGNSKEEPLLSQFEPSIARSDLAQSRRELFLAICNDMFVLAHAIRVKTLVPGQKVNASHVLMEYTHLVCNQSLTISNEPNAYAYYQDLGRIYNIFEQVEQLRVEIDELIAETQNPTTSLLPHRSRVISNNLALKTLSRPSSRSQSVNRTPRRGRSRHGSRSRSRPASAAMSTRHRNSLAFTTDEYSGASTPTRERTIMFTSPRRPLSDGDIV